MNSFRKWFYRPRKDDTSLMAQFYYADEELNLVAGELDSFDGRKDPERCTALVNQLRQAQDKVLNICVEMMDELLPEERALRDFRVKFPDDVMQETLSGQLWFGAECLAAGSSILNREAESTKMRPLAKAVTKTIENVRNLLREQCLKPIPEYTEKIRESLKIFDKLFADFELSYVSAMVPVKTVEEYEMQQNVVVLFSDTLQRSAKLGLVTQEQIDNYDPALMFTIPRLAIISGLVIFPDGPLNLEKESKNMSELFRPFRTLLLKIRELLWTMSPSELGALEKCLCSMEEPDINIQSLQSETPLSSDLYRGPVSYTSDFVHKFYANYPSCRQLTPDMISLCSVKKTDKNERKRDRNNSSKSSRTRARQERQSERFLSRLTGVEERPRARRRSRRGNSQSQQQQQQQQPQLNQYTYAEHLEQDICPPPPPPPPPPKSSYSIPKENSLSQCNTSANSAHLPRIPKVNVPRNYFSSNSERRHTHSPSRPHPTQSCHLSRHRGERINTIVCACGSSSSRTSGRIEPFNHGETQSVFAYDDSPYPNSYCPGYRSFNYSEIDSRSYHHGYPFAFDSLSNNATVSPDPPDLNRHANIQNCVVNAVLADPCILSPSSFYDEDPNSSYQLTSQSDPSHDINRLGLVETSSQSERAGCGECNCCDPYKTCNGLVDQTVGYQGKIYSDDKNCLFNTSAAEESRENDRIVCSEALSGPVPSRLPPVPEPRHSHTSLRPYGSRVPTIRMCSKEAEDRIREGDESRIRNHDAPVQTICDESKKRDCADNDDVGSSGSTSPHHSGTEDDEEVALALQAAEVAASWKARERFSDSGDLIQRLFVCISGVADQLQTNYASDLRKILRCVFLMNQTPEKEEEPVKVKEEEQFPSAIDAVSNDDGTSTNGSEQLSVESAEDALEVIGSGIDSERLNSPDEVSDIEVEAESSLHLSSSCRTSESGSRPAVHTSSVAVPPSVFNDHSLMQYSTMSPPPFLSDQNYVPGTEVRDVASDNDSPSNEISFSETYDGCLNSIDCAQPDSLVLQAASDSSAVKPSFVEGNLLSTIAVATVVSSAEASESVPSSAPQSPIPAPDSTENVFGRRYPIVQEPPLWIPDHLAPRCMACGALFTVVRRRHHCRNCGKVFCGHCSRHSVPLPHFGIWKNVRVCNGCFLYYVTSSADGSSALS